MALGSAVPKLEGHPCALNASMALDWLVTETEGHPCARYVLLLYFSTSWNLSFIDFREI